MADLTNDRLDAIIKEGSQTLASMESRRALMRAAIRSDRSRAPRIYALLNLLRDCVEYLQQDPATVGGRPEAERLVARIDAELARGVIASDGSQPK